MLKFCLAGQYPLDPARIGGGVDHAVFVLAQTLAERDDIELHVVTPAKGADGLKVVENQGMTVYYVGAPRRRLLPNLLTQSARIAPVIRQINPDIVNSHHCVTTEAAKRAGRKVLHTIHGITYRELPYVSGAARLSTWLQVFLDRRAVATADAVVGVAQYALDAMSPWIRGRRFIMRLPIEDLFWDVPDLRPRNQIVFAGGIGRRKNLMVLLRALPEVLARHPDTTLNVCGGIADAGYYRRVISFIEEVGIAQAVTFHGVVDRPRLAETLGRSVALVIPSYQETTPTVICQAMAAARVPVASRVGGVAEMIEDGVTGFTMEPDDAGTLASILIRLLDDPASAEAVGAAARACALERYERHRVVAGLVDICREMAGADVADRST